MKIIFVVLVVTGIVLAFTNSRRFLIFLTGIGLEVSIILLTNNNIFIPFLTGAFVLLYVIPLATLYFMIKTLD